MGYRKDLPILFNTSLSDLLFIIDNIDFANYADDSTAYWGDDSITDVVLSLQSSAKKVFHWFFDNQMKGNTSKCHLLLSKNDKIKLEEGETCTINSTSEKLLGVKTGKKISLDEG